MMGKSPAFLAVDRKYSRNHMWAAEIDAGYRIGLSSYAVKLLGDITHLQWSVKAGVSIDLGQQIGFIEGSKATSDLYAPIAGEVSQLNDEPPKIPSLLNSNPYEAWLLAIVGSGQNLLTAEEYVQHLQQVWPLAQRILKGQVGGNEPDPTSPPNRYIRKNP